MVPDGELPENGWYFARQDLHENRTRLGGGFSGCITTPELLEKPAWWRMPGSKLYAPYLSDNQLIKFPHFVSPIHCENLLAPALIWETALGNAKVHGLFDRRLHECRLARGREANTWRVYIPLKLDGEEDDEPLLLPQNGVAMFVTVEEPG